MGIWPSGQEACILHERAWIQILTQAPDSRMLLMQTVGGNDKDSKAQAPSTPEGELD